MLKSPELLRSSSGFSIFGKNIPISMKNTFLYLITVLFCAACSSTPSPNTVENMIGDQVVALTFDKNTYWEKAIEKAQTDKITITKPVNNFSFPLKSHHAPISLSGQYHNTDIKVAQLMLRVYTNAQKSTEEEAFFRVLLPAKPTDTGFDLSLDLNLPWQEGLFYYLIEEHETRSYIAGGKFEVRSPE